MFDFECSRCHDECSVDDGCDATDYCHYCAQELVVELQQENVQLQRDAEMACLEPPPDCGCAGCQIADERMDTTNLKGEE